MINIFIDRGVFYIDPDVIAILIIFLLLSMVLVGNGCPFLYADQRAYQDVVGFEEDISADTFDEIREVFIEDVRVMHDDFSFDQRDFV